MRPTSTRRKSLRCCTTEPEKGSGHGLARPAPSRHGEVQIEPQGTCDKGKGCDTFGPTGPGLVTADEVGDFDTLKIWCDVDARRCQDGRTATMVDKVPFPIACCSRFMSLQPGDIISTGTPPGVGLGQKPPTYLKGGEVMRLGIERLGTQTQHVRGAVK